MVMLELSTGKVLKKLRGHFDIINCVIGHPLLQVITGPEHVIVHGSSCGRPWQVM